MHYRDVTRKSYSFIPYKPHKARERVLDALVGIYSSKAFEVALVASVTVILGLVIGNRLFQ